MEQDWIATDVAGEEEPARERYAYFMRPEPRENMGPIEVRFDPFLEREVRRREMDVGMVRNAKTRKRVTVFLDPIPHVRIEKGKPLQGWYKGKHEPAGVRPRPCFTDALLTEPYGGYCTVGCAFCYINSGARGYRGTGLVTVPMRYGEQLEDQLRRLRTGSAGYFSSFTDPFLPLELDYHNSQQGAEAFDRAGLPVFFLSRLAYPGWAIDLLARNPYSYAQKSLNTGSDEDYRRLSPGALALSDHIEEVRELRRRGVYTSIQVNPIVPGIVEHEHIRVLFERLAEAGNNHVIVKFVEAAYSWVPDMIGRLRRRFGDVRADRFAELFTQNLGGQRTVAQDYRLEAHALYRRWAGELGMTYATCYEFRSTGPRDSVGVSIGREFTTAAQCHGHRVPMFSRTSELERFAPLPECPPSGCLYCAEENAGEARCGDELMGRATALRTRELRTPIGGREGRQLPVLTIGRRETSRTD